MTNAVHPFGKHGFLLAVCGLLAAGGGRAPAAPGPAPAAAGADPNGPAITLASYADGETIRYPVPLLQGTLSDRALTSVAVTNLSSSRPAAGLTGLAHVGRFKALIELVPGTNRIVIGAGRQKLPVRLIYRPATSEYVVRIVYAVDSSGRTDYQTPDAKHAQDYAGRLGTMMRLHQTFTAERMHDLGLGRRTFNLEYDATGGVAVRVLRCDQTAEQICARPGGGGGLHGYLAGQLHRQLPHPHARNLIIPAFSRFDPETRRNRAYTALGGGDVALFGGSGMYCFPASLAGVQAAFMDATPIDTSRYSSDSVGRDVYWANASTSMGGALHELGHTFGLPHSRDGWDIMTRGFDFFSRCWVLREAPHRKHAAVYDFQPNRCAHWSLASAAWLRHTPWFSPEPPGPAGANRIQVSLGTDTNQFVATSPDGIGAVILGAPGSASTAVPRDWLAPAPTRVVVNARDYPKDLDGARPWLRIIDTRGHERNVFLNEARAAAVRPPPPPQRSRRDL